MNWDLLVDWLFVQALHHPFTAPNPEDMDDLPSARALAYDLVYNGTEVAFVPFRVCLYCGMGMRMKLKGHGSDSGSGERNEGLRIGISIWLEGMGIGNG